MIARDLRHHDDLALDPLVAALLVDDPALEGLPIDRRGRRRRVPPGSEVAAAFDEVHGGSASTAILPGRDERVSPDAKSPGVGRGASLPSRSRTAAARLPG